MQFDPANAGMPGGFSIPQVPQGAAPSAASPQQQQQQPNGAATPAAAHPQPSADDMAFLNTPQSTSETAFADKQTFMLPGMALVSVGVQQYTTEEITAGKSSFKTPDGVAHPGQIKHFAARGNNPAVTFIELPLTVTVVDPKFNGGRFQGTRIFQVRVTSQPDNDSTTMQDLFRALFGKKPMGLSPLQQLHGIYERLAQSPTVGASIGIEVSWADKYKQKKNADGKLLYKDAEGKETTVKTDDPIYQYKRLNNTSALALASVAGGAYEWPETHPTPGPYQGEKIFWRNNVSGWRMAAEVQAMQGAAQGSVQAPQGTGAGTDTGTLNPFGS